MITSRLIEKYLWNGNMYRKIVRNVNFDIRTEKKSAADAYNYSFLLIRLYDIDDGIQWKLSPYYHQITYKHKKRNRVDQKYTVMKLFKLFHAAPKITIFFRIKVELLEAETKVHGFLILGFNRQIGTITYRKAFYVLNSGTFFRIFIF